VQEFSLKYLAKSSYRTAIIEAIPTQIIQPLTLQHFKNPFGLPQKKAGPVLFPNLLF
jgi:hypothetical protein